ncbi:hypothetical protein ABIA96_007337 [Bradyrhizobium sp. LB11.1]
MPASIPHLAGVILNLVTLTCTVMRKNNEQRLANTMPASRCLLQIY